MCYVSGQRLLRFTIRTSLFSELGQWWTSRWTLHIHLDCSKRAPQWLLCLAHHLCLAPDRELCSLPLQSEAADSGSLMTVTLPEGKREKETRGKLGDEVGEVKWGKKWWLWSTILFIPDNSSPVVEPYVCLLTVPSKKRLTGLLKKQQK